MAKCFDPLLAVRFKDGSVQLGHSRSPLVADPNLFLPCGKCIGCLMRRAQSWALRLGHEHKLHEHSIFLTLSYKEEFVPPRGKFRYKDVQRFLRKLRKVRAPLRFFCVAEFGELRGRAHYHLLIFGPDFSKGRRRVGKDLFTHPDIDRSWSVDGELIGKAEFGDVTQKSIAYVSGYVTEKLDLPVRKGWDKPFSRMSLNPAIGKEFLEKFKFDFTDDFALYDGRKVPLPRYYRDQLKREMPLLVEELDARARAKKFERGVDVLEASIHPDRLRAASEVAHSKRRFFSKRNREL